MKSQSGIDFLQSMPYDQHYRLKIRRLPDEPGFSWIGELAPKNCSETAPPHNPDFPSADFRKAGKKRIFDAGNESRNTQALGPHGYAMKQIGFSITILIFLLSCLNKTKKQKEATLDSLQVATARKSDTIQKLDTTNLKIFEYSELAEGKNEIPPNGTYRFEIAFAEWEGISMGEKVTVVITGDSIKVIYEGDGQLTLTEKGEVMDEGRIMKHKSGDWIIATDPSDKRIDEIGGCTGGPAIIDFKNKKYWMC